MDCHILIKNCSQGIFSPFFLFEHFKKKTRRRLLIDFASNRIFLFYLFTFFSCQEIAPCIHFIKNHQCPKRILLFKLKLNVSCCLFNTIPFLTYLIISPLTRSEFRGSQAAEMFLCGRTKTAAIVNCLGDHFFEKLKSDMQEMPYSLMLDGSNDTGLSKTFPITV